MSASVIPNEVAIFNEETDEISADSNETEKGTFDQIIEANKSEFMQIFSTMFYCINYKTQYLKPLVARIGKPIEKIHYITTIVVAYKIDHTMHLVESELFKNAAFIKLTAVCNV